MPPEDLREPAHVGQDLLQGPARNLRKDPRKHFFVLQMCTRSRKKFPYTVGGFKKKLLALSNIATLLYELGTSTATTTAAATTAIATATT